MLSLARRARALRDTGDQGITALEYALIAAAIAVVIFGMVFALGGSINSVFRSTNCAVTNNNNAGSCPEPSSVSNG